MLNRRTFVIEAGKAFPIVAGALYVTSSHVHTVTLSAGQLSTLASGGSLTVTSTQNTVTGNHSHDFTFQGKKS
jgi:hypothetical protein